MSGGKISFVLGLFLQKFCGPFKVSHYSACIRASQNVGALSGPHLGENAWFMLAVCTCVETPPFKSQPIASAAKVTKISEKGFGLKTLAVITTCSDLGPLRLQKQKKQGGTEILCFSLAFRQMLEMLQLEKCHI